MNWTILPAGTTHDRDRDAGIIAQIVSLADELAPGSGWAAQVMVPPEMVLDPDDKTPVNMTAKGKVQSACNMATRLPSDKPEFYIDEETTTDPRIRSRRVAAVADEVFRAIRRPASGCYAIPRLYQDGRMGEDPMGAFNILYDGGIRQVCPRAYFNTETPPVLDQIVSVCRLFGVSCKPFFSGQYRGDKGLVPADALRQQRDDLPEYIESGVLWCNIGSPLAADGIANFLKVWGGD